MSPDSFDAPPHVHADIPHGSSHGSHPGSHQKASDDSSTPDGVAERLRRRVPGFGAADSYFSNYRKSRAESAAKIGRAGRVWFGAGRAANSEARFFDRFSGETRFVKDRLKSMTSDGFRIRLRRNPRVARVVVEQAQAWNLIGFALILWLFDLGLVWWFGNFELLSLLIPCSYPALAGVVGLIAGKPGKWPPDIDSPAADWPRNWWPLRLRKPRPGDDT